MSVAAADAAARFQVKHCERHHGRGCRLEACNLAREWRNMRRGPLRNYVIEEVARTLRESGASDEAVKIARRMKRSG